MNEQQVSVEGRSLPLPEPFMVIATQNPAGHQGTYPLPESQLDRFLMRLRIGYPDARSEREIIRHPSAPHGESTPCVLALYRAVQAHALVDGRTWALPDDVKILAPKVLGHRVMPAVRSSLSARRNPSDAAGERVIEEILSQLAVPL